MVVHFAIKISRSLLLATPSILCMVNIRQRRPRRDTREVPTFSRLGGGSYQGYLFVALERDRFSGKPYDRTDFASHASTGVGVLRPQCFGRLRTTRLLFQHCAQVRAHVHVNLYHATCTRLAVDKYTSEPYPAVQAFGAGLSGLLEIHDAGVVSLRAEYIERKRHMDKSGTQQNSRSPLALSDLWRATQPQRNFLWFFCSALWPRDSLKCALTRFADSVGVMSEEAWLETVMKVLEVSSLSLCFPWWRPQSTLLSEKKLICFLDRDSSWFVLEHLVERLQVCRTLLHGLHRENVIDSTGGSYFYSMSCLSDAFVNLVVISVLLRKVSRSPSSITFRGLCFAWKWA